MKVALCQLNPTVGAFSANKKKILEAYRIALQDSPDIVVFPELSITGYPPQDLLNEIGFVAENLRILAEISSETTIPLILGYVRPEGDALFNAAAVCENGEVVYSYDKQLLPTYDVFDEARYFKPGGTPGIWETCIGGKNWRVGLEICEDLWDDDYPVKVTDNLVAAGADLIVNISASPFHKNRLSDRLYQVHKKMKPHKVPFVYCNLVGAQDELIFDGQSLVLNGNHQVIALAKAFHEDYVLCDINIVKSNIVIKEEDPDEGIYQGLLLGIKDYFAKTGHREAVIGLSGGIDSALVAVLAADALGPEHVHGVTMPSRFSSRHSRSDSEILAANTGIHFDEISIQGIVNQYERDLKPFFAGTARNIAEENLQARARGNLLMALSNKFGWIVLSTGNKTELALGYCTLYGDMSGGLAVISDLSKSVVYRLSRWINQKAGFDRIPQNCLQKPPSAELAPDQVDPFDYNVVSPLVDALVENRMSISQCIAAGFDEELVRHVFHLIRTNEFKRRQAPPGLRISKKAFGLGRRIPIVNHFQGR